MNKQHKIFNLVEYYLDSSSHYLNLNKNSIQNYCLHLNDFSFYVANKNVDFKKIDYKFIQNYFYNYVKSNPSHYFYVLKKLLKLIPLTHYTDRRNLRIKNCLKF